MEYVGNDDFSTWLSKEIDISEGFNDCKEEKFEEFVSWFIDSTDKGVQLNREEKKKIVRSSSYLIANECNKMCKPYRTVLLLSANQFVIVRELTPRTIVRAIRAAQQNTLNQYLLEQSRPGNEFDIQKIIDELTKCPCLTKYSGNLHECVSAFSNGLYFPSAVGVIAICDGFLSDLSKSQKTSFKLRMDGVIEKAFEIIKNRYGENQELLRDEVEFFDENISVISFAVSQSFFFESRKFELGEPQYINRHWLVHGRSSKPVRELDCIKFFRLLYGLTTIFKLIEQTE